MFFRTTSMLVLSILISSLTTVATKEDYSIERYRKRIESLLKQGKTYEEIYHIMDIWWPEDYASRFSGETGRAGTGDEAKSVEQKMNDIIETLAKRVAVDEQKLRDHPGGPKLTPEAMRIIKFVANLQDGTTN